MKSKSFKTAALIILGIFSGMLIYPVISADNVYNQLEKYNYVLNLAIKQYVEEVDVNKLTEGAIRGMLNELDPHSTYMSIKDFKSESENMQGSFEGIGIEFSMINDTISVVSPIVGGPSEAVGMMAGDKITEINGDNAVKISDDSVRKLLRGPKGTAVILGVHRVGEKKLLSFNVVRDKIPVHSVYSYYMLPNTEIGVVQVNRFSATTHDEMMNAVHELKKQGMTKMILDLQSNPGGLLQQAFYMADEFLAGDTIVYTKAREAKDNEVYIARKGNELEDIPLIVLINSGSASASEIVSGSVQDLDRGLVVGSTSFGKGLVQRQYKISDGSALRLTIARYYTASGRCIQRPYGNKTDYNKLVGRLELEEGSNLEHALDKIKKEDAAKKDKKGKDTAINMDSIEVFHTRSGRSVLGGGGITPDYIVKSDTITKLTISIFRNNVFNEFVDKNLKNGKDIKDKYGDDFDKFYKEYQLTNSMMKELQALAEKKEIEWNDDSYKKDEDYIKAVIKGNVARVVWNVNRQQQVLAPHLKTLQKAAELFPTAEKVRAKAKKY